MYANELNKKLLAHAQNNGEQALKLIEMKNKLVEYDLNSRIYPATEVRKKLKLLVNVSVG